MIGAVASAHMARTRLLAAQQERRRKRARRENQARLRERQRAQSESRRRFHEHEQIINERYLFFFFYISLNQKITKITKNLQGTSVIETAHKKKKTRQTERVKVKS